MLRAKAEEVRKALEKIAGIVELQVESQTEIPQIDVKVNLAKPEEYGIKPGDVRRASAALVAGEEVGDIFGNRNLRRERLEHSGNPQQPDRNPNFRSTPRGRKRCAWPTWPSTSFRRLT